MKKSFLLTVFLVSLCSGKRKFKLIETEDGGSVGKYEQDKVQYTGRTQKPRKYKHKAVFERDYNLLPSPPIADYSGGQPDRCEKEKSTCNIYNKVCLKGKLHVHAVFTLKDKKFNVPFMKNLAIMNQQIPTTPGFINLQVYREQSEDTEKITYMQIENWEDEESLDNDLNSPHVKNFENTTEHMYELELKKYSNGHFFI